VKFIGTHYFSHNAHNLDFQGIWRIVHLLQSFNSAGYPQSRRGRTG